MPVFLLSLFGGVGSMFASLAALFALYVTKRVAAIVAAVIIVLSLTVALWAALTALIAGISVAVPSDLLIAASWVMPSNATACFSAYISAHVLRFAYDLKSRGVQMRLI